MPDSSASRPSAAADGLDVALGVAAVARRLGVAPGTLRTWARRYGIEPSAHEAGAQRRYTAADVSRLTLMRRLMLDGVSAGDAARTALAAPVTARRGLRRVRARDATSPPPGAPGSTARRRSGGGQVVPLRDASPAARGLARAAMSLDPRACAEALGSSLARRGVVVTWQDMVLPVLIGVGERWRATGRGVEVEHLLSECIEDELRAVTRHLEHPLPAAPVLLAAPEQEGHDLPLHAVAAALAERSIGVRQLGSGVPLVGLREAIARTGAAVVFLWAQGAVARPGPEVLAAIPDLRPRPLLVLGGAGWRVGEPGHAVRRVGDLAGAVEAVVDGLGLAGSPSR